MSQNEDLLTKYNQLKAAYDNLSEFNAQLAEEIVDLRKDKARLDWLQDKNNHIGNVQLPTKCVENNLHSLRAAIDEAMSLNSSQGGNNE